MLGLHEVLEGAPVATTSRAAEPLVCLRIAAADLLTVLSNSVQLAQGLFRMLLAPRPRAAQAPPAAGRDRRRPDPDARGRVLVQHPLFERATAPQLLALTSATVDVPLAAGAALFRAGDRPAVFLVMSGEIALESPGAASVIVRPGTTLGVAETLAGVDAEAGATVTKPGEPCGSIGGALFDILGDNVELMQGLFSGVLRLRAREAELP